MACAVGFLTGQVARSTAQHTVASPMTVDIARLGRRPGAMFELHDTVHSPARIGLELIAIDQGALLDLDLRVESVSGRAQVGDRDRPPRPSASVLVASAWCGRVQAALTELFAEPDSANRRDLPRKTRSDASSTKPSISSSRSSMRSV